MLNRKNIYRKVLFILYFLVLILAMIPLPQVSSNDNNWYDSGMFRDTTYYHTLNKWKQTYREISNVEKEIKVDDVINLNPSASYFDDELLNKKAFSLSNGDSVKYLVEVEEAGLYYLALDYRFNTDFSSNPTIDVLINGETQYNEATNLRLNVSFEQLERSKKDLYNRYGDEMLPYSNGLNKWYYYYLTDAFNEDASPYLFLLNKGENIVCIKSNNDSLETSSLYLTSLTEVPTYEEYILNYQNIEDEEIRIEAEKFTIKNDMEIKSSYYKSYAMTPNNYKAHVLNMLDGSSMSRSGMSASYSFTVQKEGLYNLTFKYKQNSLAGLAVGKNIYIDGAIPFKEFNDYLFPYQKKWVNYTLNKDGKNLKVYLSKGTHTLTLQSTSQHNIDVLYKLYEVMDKINSLGITINTITGSSSNTNISWKITKYLPTLESDLLAYAKELNDAYNYINSLNPTSKQANEVSMLKVAASKLERLAKKPNKIQNRLGELSNGSGSSYQLIGSAIGYLMNHTMDIDFISLHGDNVKFKKANGSFFGRLWFNIKSFFYSFFDKRYNQKISNDEGTIDVMVASSNLYTNIIQEMIDDDFTKTTGIKVNLNILSNNQAIILNNATNTNPDVILEIDSWLPYTYALRGMLEDLSKYDGFSEITKDIYSSNFIPLIYDKGVYGIPETQGMQLMFYRSDILNSLGLSAPNTWDDVIKILPILQSYQMNFYHPLGYDSAYKGFSLTSPFLYMFNSEVYSDSGYTAEIGSENSVEAVKFMTDLFNIYNLPQQVSSFFEHFRSGTLPIGIGSVDMYLQLKYACPELSGQWGVLPIPGVYNEKTNEVERWTTTYGKCSIMFSSSKKLTSGWEFIKWWHSTKTQITYNQKIKTSLGEKYLIVPANMTALSNSMWDKEILTCITKAAKFSRIPAVIPGSYIVERELSNIWNQVVIEKKNVRVAINEAIPKINRELKRKFEEFGYLKNNEILKNYLVPTNSNIQNWVKGKEFYEE